MRDSQVLITANKARTNLLAFMHLMHRMKSGRDLIPAPHHVIVCDALTRVLRGEVKRLIINIPPRSGKTLIVSQMLPAFWLGLNPASQFILTSYSKTLSTANTYAIREIIRHEGYRWLWSKEAGNHGVLPTLREDSQAKDEFYTDQGGMVYAVGSGGTITGKGAGGMDDPRAGAILIDDIAKPDESQSSTMRQNVIDWFSGTLESRKNHPDTPIIIISQRLHENDLPGFLLNGGNGEEWELLKIPARDETGASFWPRQFPDEMLSRLEQASPYVFAGQYMQDPTPKGGGDFKPSNIQIVDAIPAGLKFTRGWDLAATTHKTSDYTASAKIGIDADGIVWIADMQRFRGGPDDVERTIIQTAQLDGRETKQSLPKDPGQAGVAQAANLSKKLQGVRFEFSPESGDKRSRAMPFAAQVNAGNVRLLSGEHNAAFIHEMESFPNGAHDDMVDACSRAYNDIITGRISAITSKRLF